MSKKFANLCSLRTVYLGMKMTYASLVVWYLTTVGVKIK